MDKKHKASVIVELNNLIWGFLFTFSLISLIFNFIACKWVPGIIYSIIALLSLGGFIFNIVYLSKHKDNDHLPKD